MQIFAIKDRALNAFMQPFPAPTIGAAIRAFADGINDGSTPMNKHPDDYDLWHISSWNDNTGKYTELEQGPTQVAIGKNMVRFGPTREQRGEI